jgi:type II secretory pathway pseudopilin PulG
MIPLPHAGGRRLCGGFSLLELVIVVCVVAVLGGFGLEKMLRYLEQAEMAAMEQTVGNMKSALNLRLATMVVDGTVGKAAGLAAENPMDWLATRPENYLGPLYNPDLAKTQKGSWYFDRQGSNLVYLPARTRHFVAGRDGKAWVRFATVVRTREERSRTEVVEVDLRPVQPYNWFKDLN